MVDYFTGKERDSFNINFLESIAELGDLGLENEEIDLKSLSKSAIESTITTINQITKLPKSEQKKIGTPKLWVQLGRVLGKLKESSFSETCYRIAILQEPKFAPAWFYLGLVWYW